MSADSRTCEKVQSQKSWDEWLANGIPEHVAVHGDSCEACSEVLGDLEKMRAGLGALARSSKEASADMSVASAVMRRLDERPQRKWSALRSWRWLSIPAIAACALAFFLLRPSGATIDIDAPRGALVEGKRLQGKGIERTVPTTVATSLEQRASLRGNGQSAELWPGSELLVQSTHLFEMSSGGISVTAADELEIQLGDVRVRGVGRFTVERRSNVETEMKTLRKHHVAGSAAIVAIAVYAGWANLITSDSRTRVEATGGAYVDGSGQTRRFGLASPEEGGGDVVAMGRGDGAQGRALSPADQVVSGAFWSPDKEVIEFRIQGEALDADTGEPVTSFQIVAAPVESKAYGQTKPTTRDFEDRKDGSFQLDGLGLGKWRVTGRAPGYSPVVQTVDLSDASSDPYLVIPLSVGAQITGQVVDWQGRPVTGARVGLPECLTKGASKAAHCKVVQTKADGRFTLPGLPEEQVFAVRAEHDKFGVATVRDLRQESGSSEHIVIELSGVARVFGEVSRGKGKEPVVGATVTTAEGSAQTDQNGFYEVLVPLEERPEAFVSSYPNGPRTRAKIASYPDDRSARDIVWVDAPTHVAEVRIDFRLEMEDARLFGQVSDSAGKPIANVELNLANTSGWARGRGHETFPTYARTDSEGRYSVDHIPAKAGYQVQYRLSEKEHWQGLGYVNIKDEEAVEANFQLGGGSIRGRFVNLDDQSPVALSERGCSRVGAQLLSAGPETFYMPHCYPDGRFEFTDLPAGTYRIKNRIAWMDSPVEFKEQDVKLSPSQIVGNVQVAVEGEGSTTWKLRILDAKGRFLSGAFIRYHGGNTSFTSNLDTGPDGVAKVTINQRYTELFIDCPGFQSERIDLASKDSAQVQEVRLVKAVDEED